MLQHVCFANAVLHGQPSGDLTQNAHIFTNNRHLHNYKWFWDEWPHLTLHAGICVWLGTIRNGDKHMEKTKKKLDLFC